MQIATTYAEAIGRKYPEQVVIVIAKDAQGKCNPISVGWTMLTSHDPPMMAISIGKTRHSLGVIRQAGAFVISFVSSEMVEDVFFHGTKSGRDMDKLTAFGTKTQPATEIDCVVLADAVANFECVLESEMETGDHVIFAGRIVASHVNKDAGVRRLYSLGDNKLGGVLPG
jgi:flavin reductase (DIM6/NTAB) family NADH-FMN oxidoreductase RutF